MLCVRSYEIIKSTLMAFAVVLDSFKTDMIVRIYMQKKKKKGCLIYDFRKESVSATLTHPSGFLVLNQMVFSGRHPR